MNLERLLDIAHRLEDLQRESGLDGLVGAITQLIRAQDLLISRYAPFKVGDRAVLTRTPEITREKSCGWMGSRHFLVEGRAGVISEVEIWDGKFRFGFEPDNQTWICSFGNHEENPVDRPHSYSFGESWLAPEPVKAPEPVACPACGKLGQP